MNEKFERYLELLTEANSVMNLTAVREPSEIRVRHFEDSLALLGAVDFKDKSLLDVGSGAGFPGLALKIAEPSISLTMLEATGKKADFLNRTAKALDTGAKVINARAEEYAHTRARAGFDIVTARGVAALPLLAELCLPFVKRGGYFLAMKSSGQESANFAELGGAFERLYSYTLTGGISHSVIIVRKIEHTKAVYPRQWAVMKKKPL